MDLTDLHKLSRLSARALAAMRCGIGVVALTRPSIPASLWVGASESDRFSVQVFARALGGRDLVLGAGALTAESDAALAKFAALGAVADGIDFLATLKDFMRLPRLGRLLVLGSTLGACAIGLIAAKGLHETDDVLAAQTTG